MPLLLFLYLILFLVFVFPWLMLSCFCGLCVRVLSGGSSSGHQARRKNPDRATGSKRYRSSDVPESAGGGGEGVSSEPPKRKAKVPTLKTSTGRKPANLMSPMEFCTKRNDVYYTTFFL